MHRYGVVLLAAVMMLGTLIVGGHVFAAQDATPVTPAEHPLVGAWLVDAEPENPDNQLELDIFSADGTLTGVLVDGVTAGVWEPTGENTANITFRFLDVEGSGIIRASIEVAPDGESFTGTYTLEFIDPDGTSSGEIGPGLVEGTRLAVEPMGTPVASFEEAFGAEPAATPEG
jgi:hypothetical protein